MKYFLLLIKDEGIPGLNPPSNEYGPALPAADGPLMWLRENNPFDLAAGNTLLGCTEIPEAAAMILQTDKNFVKE